MMIITLTVNCLIMENHGPHSMTNCGFIIIDVYEDTQQVGEILSKCRLSHGETHCREECIL